MSLKKRLEITRLDKEVRPEPEPTILLEDAALSHCAATKKSGEIFDNLLIHGDNLLALKSLEQDYTGKVKCVCIDPPYNTGNAFRHYDDGVEHSRWLGLMRDRIELLHRLLSDDGSIWISIDDNELSCLKIMLDEIFGRNNFAANIIWEKRTTRENRRVFSFRHDYILVFAKNRKKFEAIRNKLPLNEELLARYKNPDNDPRGPWQSITCTAQAGHATVDQFYQLTTPSGRKIDPPPGLCWVITKPRFEEMNADNRIWFGQSGNNIPRRKRFLLENPNDGLTPETIWFAKDVGTNDSAKRGLIQMFDGKDVFGTPKPEGVIERIVHIATNPGDLVLDCFAGSGTTGAVAHKMKRRWIMIELNEQCKTVCQPRLCKVIDGKDNGGITKAVGWKGGGGFRYYKPAPAQLET